MSCACIEFQNFMEQLNLRIFPIYQGQSGNSSYKFRIEGTKPAHTCPSAKFLVSIRYKTIKLDFVEYQHPSKCHQFIHNNIVKINKDTKEWKNGGLCANCAINYSQQDFDLHLTVFDRLIAGGYQESMVHVKLVKVMEDFLFSLDHFDMIYNCIENKKPSIPK